MFQLLAFCTFFTFSAFHSFTIFSIIIFGIYILFVYYINMGVTISGNTATFTYDGTSVLTRAVVKNANLSSGVTSVVITGYDGIGYGAFSYLTNLSTVSISSSVTSIGDYAFYNCSALDSFTVPTDSQLTSIGNFAFQGCPANTSVRIPLN
jgi:hypothetical protein